MCHSPRRWLVLFLAIGCALAARVAPAFGRDATITLNDGRQFTGEVVSDTDKVVELKISGISTPFARENIKSVDFKLTIEEQYAQERAAMADDDLEKRYALAHWLYENRSYTLAQREVADLMKRFPDVDKLKNLSRDIDQKIKLQDEPRGINKAPAHPGPHHPAENPNLPGAAQELTDEQINLIRVYQVEPDDHPFVSVDADAIDKLLADNADNDMVPKGPQAQQDFRLAPGWQQLKLMFDLRARGLYSKAHVRDDPPMMLAFRDINQSYVMNYCGTAGRCHGGENSGPFFLFHNDNNATRVYYSNYLILDRYQDSKGMMLDAKEPMRSYLIQYGMRREDAATPHPDVPGWEPRLRTFNEGVGRDLLKWVASIPTPRIIYPVDYTPPAPKSVVVNRPAAPAAPGAPTRPSR